MHAKSLIALAVCAVLGLHDEAGAKRPAAAKIRYSNAASGLGATNVQDALDSVAARLQHVVRGGVATGERRVADAGGSAPTTWSGTVYDVVGADGDTLNTNDIAVTFTPASDTTGTLASSAVNVLSSVASTYPQPCGDAAGTYAGTYHIVENVMFVTGMKNPAGEAACPSSGFLNIIAVSPTKLVLTAGTSLPAPLIVLEKAP